MTWRAAGGRTIANPSGLGRDGGGGGGGGGGAQGGTEGGSADSLAPPDVDMGKAAVVAAVAMALKRRKEGGSNQ